ncbi:MAG: MGMT family protein [Butyrivibrio sp.]|nr:MGMT family protein [Butyrivibrio sp.]
MPCHRVVNSKGELAGEYAFGEAWKQAQILESEGVEVIEGKVNLEKYEIQNTELNCDVFEI